MTRIGRLLGSGLVLAGMLLSAAPAHAAYAVGEPRAAAAGPESARMVRAKDLMADDQWGQAIALLRAAADDVKEPNRDEALFWLAHSQNRVGDYVDAVESIRRLQREYPKSRWSAPGSSLMIELAQKLGREDVLWYAAKPPAAPPPPKPPVKIREGQPAPPSPPPAPPAPGPATAAPAPTPPARPAPPPPPAWIETPYVPSPDLRVEALSRLINTDAHKVIPMLREIAVEADNPGAARRAVFVLAQSRNPDAQATVVDLARTGPPRVRVAAVRDLGLFGGPEIAKELLQVYRTADVPVRQQVVRSLGERSDTGALVRIVQSEQERSIREHAILTLGRVGGREPLREMYPNANREMRRAIIRGLSTARDDEGLIRIAKEEKDPELRRDALTRLRLLGTDKARAYLDSLK